MKLQDLRVLEEKRTQGEWRHGVHAWHDFVVGPKVVDDVGCISPDDAEFISAFANHAKALLDVVEAAKKIICEGVDGIGCAMCGEEELIAAIKRMEELP